MLVVVASRDGPTFQKLMASKLLLSARQLAIFLKLSFHL